jgi:4-amino-4-deoxy-L-arabinose transferase-like glycosyltransferase
MPLSTIFPSRLSQFLVLSFLVLRLIFWLATFPNPDESYYWLWGQHPALSYYDHPPLQAWVQGIVSALLGHSFFVLRLPNLLSNLGFFYVYYQIAKYLYGDRGLRFFGVTSLLILASPLYFLFFALAWHDHLLILFSLIAAYLLIRFLDDYLVNAEMDWQLYAGAGALGCAFLCKYNAIFVALGILATILSTKALRMLFGDRRFYVAVCITLSFFLPILLWNISNDFQSFRYYLTRSVDAGFSPGLHLRLDQPLSFWLVSILMLSPVNIWAIAQSFRHQPRFQHPTVYRKVAGWIFVISTVGLSVIALFSTALYYWNITAYLLLFPLLPSVFDRGRSLKTRDESCSPLLNSKSFYMGQFYGLLFASLLVIHYAVLPLSAFSSPDADPDSRMLYGWQEVVAVVQRQQAELGENMFWMTTDYRSASALAYALENPQVVAISERIDQFDFWMKPTELAGKNAVILADDWHPVPPKLVAQFERMSAPVVIPVIRFGVWIKQYRVIQAYGFRGAP